MTWGSAAVRITPAHRRKHTRSTHKHTRTESTQSTAGLAEAGMGTASTIPLLVGYKATEVNATQRAHAQDPTDRPPRVIQVMGGIGPPPAAVVKPAQKCSMRQHPMRSPKGGDRCCLSTSKSPCPGGACPQVKTVVDKTVHTAAKTPHTPAAPCICSAMLTSGLWP
jgi:hypothetical protein